LQLYAIAATFSKCLAAPARNRSCSVTDHGVSLEIVQRLTFVGAISPGVSFSALMA
jgi:hypothetical protein